MRRRLAYFLLLVFCVPLVLRADDASKTAKIHEFFKVAKLDQLSAQAMQLVENQVKSGMVQQVFGTKVPADQQQRADELSDQMTKIVSNALSWDALEPEYTKIYAAAYTEQQIDDLIAFYKSPTGQVLVENTPILMKQASAITQEHMASAAPQIRKLLTDYIAEEQKRMQQPKPKQ